MTEDGQVLHDELEKMIAQEVVAKALDDATRQAFEEEKRNIASQKRAAQATSINKLSTGRSSISTATTPYVSAASTPTGANAGESSFIYFRGKIPIDASTLPIADLPINLNMPDLEDDVNDHTCVACKKGKQHKASCLENQLNHNVKIIRCDNGTEFKNHAMNEFCAKKGIKREFSSLGKDKGPTQEYILLPLQPHRTRILVEDVAPAAHEKPFESFS
ncbi:ribonuclease H-like domain-containing protein [Tanacetum coccineum]|uniref:Ribonuclease H-like domain-containing protein n=1 Tax=Tanacetum coccineum TaxID=301880 RepID=A0ABQ4X4I0_9ASTR